MSEIIKFIRYPYKDPNISEWLINDNIVRLHRIFKEDQHNLQELINDIKTSIADKTDLITIIKTTPFSTILNIMTLGFPTITANYLYKMASSMDDNMITVRDLCHFIFGKDIPTKLNLAARNAFNKAVNDVNTAYRLRQFKNIDKSSLNNDWSICFIQRNVGTFKWKINDVNMSFIGINYTTKQQIQLTLNEIEYHLISFIPFNKLEKIHHTGTIAKICSDIMPELLERYLRHFARVLTSDREVITELKVNKLIFSKYRTDTFECNYNKVVSKIVAEEYRNQHKIFIEKNDKINFSYEVWILYFDNKKSINSYKFDFSVVDNSIFRYEIKSYLKNRIIEDPACVQMLKEDFRLLVSGINFLINNNKNLKYSADVTLVDIKSMFSYFSNEYISKDKKKLSPKTLTVYCGKFRRYYEWLIDNADFINTKRPSINHFNKIKWSNIENIIRNTDYIPESVVKELLNHIDELNSDFQVMLLIMLNGGLHFKDVALLRKDCIEEDGFGNFVLKYIPYKIHKKRINSGLEKYHKIIIHRSVAEEILNQISRTRKLREDSGFDEIFIHKNNEVLMKVYDAKSFNNAVNKVLVKFNVTDENGKLWRFTSKQCRKTLAVDMIMNGAQSNEVANYLAHSQISTTNKYYVEVRKMKLADMNDEFWSREFKSIVPKDQLEQFTEEERKVLYAEFKLGMREVELGYCMKGFWEEPCSKLSGKINCATCGKICVGIQKLSKWKNLMESQERVVRSLIYGYKKVGISDYKNYREFQREIYLLNIYRDSVSKILEFSEDECI